MERYVVVGYWIDGYAEFEPGSRGFAGWSYTEEELREFDRAQRRKRIIKLIRELEKQLAIEYAWTETEHNERLAPFIKEIQDLERRKTTIKAQERHDAVLDEIADLERQLEVRRTAETEERQRYEAIVKEIRQLERRKATFGA